MIKKKKRLSFTLLEVMISLIILFGAFIPIVQDLSTRMKLYRDMKEKTIALASCEEQFFSELAWIATSSSEECSLQLLQTGYIKKEPIIGTGKRIIIQFSPIVIPTDHSIKKYLGKLSTEVETERKTKEALAPPFGYLSIDLFFAEKTV